MSKAKKRPMIESDSDDSDASDLDEEVLTLASAAKRPKPAPPTTTTHQSSGSDSSSESDDEWTMDGKSSARKKGKGQRKRFAGLGGKVQGKKLVTQKRHVTGSSSDSSDDDDNDGDQIQGSISSSSSSSSDSESSSDESLKFDDGLDDDLVGDEEDRTKLAGMTESEREQEMYKRYERRQALQARFEIEKKLRREKAEKKRQKEREEKQKRGLREKRRRTEDKTKSRAIDELKAKRSADKQRKTEVERQQQMADKHKREPLKASEVFSSASDEDSSSSSSSPSYQGDSDDEAGKRSLAGLYAAGSKYISTLEEMSKLKLSRFRLEKWVHMPFFVETAVGCFVRVGIGAHEGRMVYRVCEIIGVQETPKIYSIGSTKTNKGLRLRHGLQERTFRIEYVSNSPFTEAEFSKWKAEMEKRGLPLPTVHHVQKKGKQLDEARNFEFRDEDIDRIIEEKQKYRKNPRNYAMTKNRLMREKELAEQQGDVEKVAHLTEQLESLEERADHLDKQRTKGLSAISYINERNRQRNVISAEQALKEEMAGREQKEDPFTRRKCQPTLVTLTRDAVLPGATELLQKLSQAQSEEDREALEAAMKEQAPHLLSPSTPNGQSSSIFGAPLQTPEDMYSPALHTQERKPDVDDLFSAHDFDIHIDLPTGPEGTDSGVKALPKVTPPPKNEGPRRSLNLADYKKRRGLI